MSDNIKRLLENLKAMCARNEFVIQLSGCHYSHVTVLLRRAGSEKQKSLDFFPCLRREAADGTRDDITREICFDKMLQSFRNDGQ